MALSSNTVERCKAEKDGLDVLNEIEELAEKHKGWETIASGDLERLKWGGIFFRKPTPGLFMMRIRITNGQVNSTQLSALARIARQLGNGILDTTTRQQIQLRAIKIGDIPNILRTLDAVGLTSLQTGGDNVRNVNCCPLAGLTPMELFDAAPVGIEFTTLFLKNKAFSNLPRKFNVTITGCQENCTPAESQDIAMTPAVRETFGTPGFNVAVGGKMGSRGMTAAQPLDVFVEPHQAANLAAEIVRLFRDEGFRDQRTTARLAFLLDAWGIEHFRAILEKRWGQPLERAGRDVRLSHQTDHLGVNPQRQEGLYSVGLSAPTGRLSSDQTEMLACLADEYGTGEVRLTTAKNIVLVNVPEGKLAGLLGEPLLQILSPTPHPIIRGLVTCTGTDYCNLALMDSKNIGIRLAEIISERFPDAPPLTSHWSGCPAGCGNHQAADIGFQGCKARVNGEVMDAVHVFVGGRTGINPKPGIKIMELVPVHMLEEFLPVIINNLELLSNIQKDPETEEQQVLMVPTLV